MRVGVAERIASRERRARSVSDKSEMVAEEGKMREAEWRALCR
jgi:hypothetical protein